MLEVKIHLPAVNREELSVREVFPMQIPTQILLYYLVFSLL